MTWTIDEFKPSDGSKQGHVPVDHVVWLRGARDGRRVIHIAMQVSSLDVPEGELRMIAETMCTALDGKMP